MLVKMRVEVRSRVMKKRSVVWVNKLAFIGFSQRSLVGLGIGLQLLAAQGQLSLGVKNK
jgi:hypothetical protein